MENLESLKKAMATWETTPKGTEPERQVWEDLVMDELYVHRRKDIGPLAMELIRMFQVNDRLLYPGASDPSPEEWFTWEGKSFMEAFARQIHPDKKLEIDKKIIGQDMVMFNECYVENYGDINKISTNRFKKSSEDIIKQLSGLNVDVNGYKFINCRLLLSYYHRIHFPCDGKITRMINVERESDFFGDNSLMIIEINNIQRYFSISDAIATSFSG